MTAIETAPAPVKPRVRVAALTTRHSYSGASQANANIALWRPPLKSADGDVLRDAGKVRARARDLRRNHPYAQQAVRASRLGVVGRQMRYSCRPDHRFLGIDFEEAVRWGQEFERVWESYAHHHGFFVDAARRLNFTSLMALAHDSLFTDGEAFLTAEWDPSRRWHTCFQAVDVDRLSNPHGAPDTPNLKAGVVMDGLSAPIGYFVRNAHPGDHALLGARSMEWSPVNRWSPWGRPVALHVFEQERPGQTRGVSAFASVISAMKMGAEYTETALQQAILQSSYAAVITSQQNYAAALEIIGAMPPDQAATIVDLAEENLEAAMQHHEAVKLRFNGAQIPVLWPGEDLKMTTPATGAASIGEFQGHSTKSYAAGTGTDPIQVSQDYSQVNYSSAKMAAATSFRHYEVRRQLLIWGVAMPMIAAFLEEAVFRGGLPLPRGISPLDFYDAQDALIRGTLITQGAPMLDPTKERQAQKMGLEIGVETLQSIAASEGRDYIDDLDQLARERMERAARGLPEPGMPATMPPVMADDEAAADPESESEDDA